MKVLSLRVENILSIKNVELDFQDHGLMLVEGWNYDDGRANGAGKTAIFNALSFALYGKLPRKITASEVLRKGTKKGYAEADILVGGNTYTVRRERPKALSFKKDGESVTMTQEEFEYKIKLSYDQFLISMYTAQQSSNKFLDLNDTQKKDFLLQLMNLNEFAMCRKTAELEVKELNQKIDEENIKLEKAKSKIDAYSESTDVEYSQNIISNMNASIDKMNTEIQQLQLVSKPNLNQYFELESKLTQKLEKLAAIRAVRNKEHDEFIKLSDQIHQFVPTDPDANCPHCKGELMIQGKSVSKPGDIAIHKANHEAKMNEIKDQMKIKKATIDQYDNELSKDSQLRTLLKKTRDKRDSESSEYNRAKSRMQELINQVSVAKNTIQRETDNINKINELKSKINILKQYVLQAASVISDYTSNRDIYKAVSSMCSPTGAPAYIMDAIVDSFNEIVSDHISLIWPNAAYSLQSYKESKSGDMTAKFSESLIINGKQRSIGSLSGGEQRALSLAIDFAIVDILSQQFGMPMNPIVMDEPFEGLDATGREIVIELLGKLSTARQIWVIDHASEAKSMFSQILRVEKRNGVSSLV